MAKPLVEQIMEIYPELVVSDFYATGKILVRDDSDGLGEYIDRWNYDQPIPENMKLGK